MTDKEDFEVFCYESEEGAICLEFGDTEISFPKNAFLNLPTNLIKCARRFCKTTGGKNRRIQNLSSAIEFEFKLIRITRNKKMNDFSEDNHEKQRRNLQIWDCDSCQVIHFKADKVLLNFTRTEFADLTHAVVKLYRQQCGSLEFFDLLGLIKQRDDVLISQTMS